MTTTTTTTETCAGGAAGVRPLLSEGRRVVVDGHAICAECGGAVEPVGPEQWRHGLTRRPRVTLLLSYRDFAKRFPWVSVSEPEWQDADRCLSDYRRNLKTLTRRRKLGSDENPCLDLFRQLMASRPSPLLDLAERRRELASLFSWAIPTDAALDLLSKYAPLVECGAGMGYWLALLRARGVEAVGYDLKRPGPKNAYHRTRQPWTEIQRQSSVNAARRHRDRTLLLCWPPYDDDAASYQALRAYRGDVVIHIGERDEGATGSVRFHRELALNWTLAEELELPHWPRLEDRVMVYRRNPRRRPLLERDRCFECSRYISTGAIGRCDACFKRRPPALALRAGRHRVEYPREVVAAMPAALRKAFEASPNRISVAPAAE
jgi:hypothetical protein